MNLHARVSVCLLGLLAAISNLLPGQGLRVPVPLLSTQMEIARLAPGQQAGSVQIYVDTPEEVILDVVSSIEIALSVRTPSGATLTPQNVAAMGGEFVALGKIEPSSRNVLQLFTKFGYQYFFRLPSQGPGFYTIDYTAVSLPVNEAAVLVELISRSDVKATLFCTTPRLNFGDPAVLGAIVFENGIPVKGARVTAVVTDSEGLTSTLELQDDGSDVDVLAGDGLYSAWFDPPTMGVYRALAEVVGTTSSGVPFQRGAATHFEVVESLSRLTGSISDWANDDDLDGLLDSIVFDVGTTTEKAGEYRIFVRLEGAEGKYVIESAAVELSPGPGTSQVSVDSKQIQELGQDGPFQIRLVDLVYYGENGAVLADRLDQPGMTKPYSIGRLERPVLQLTGGVFDEAYDDDGNGLLDRLRVSVEVDSLEDLKDYVWDFTLESRAGYDIQFLYGGGDLVRGTNLLSLDFDGTRIGESASNGPFRVTNLVLYKSGAQGAADPSLWTSLVGETGPYLAHQFEGFSGDWIRVPIVIKPGEEEADINLNSEMLPVAILGAGGLDLADVESSSVRLLPGEAREAHDKAHLRDLDGDGTQDLVFHFRVSETLIDCSSTAVVLVGELPSGLRFEGQAVVSVLGCNGG